MAKIFQIAAILMLTITVGAYSQSTNSGQSVLGFNGKKLIYNPHNSGDLVCDFSGAGYKGGGVPIPDNIPVKAKVSNIPGDDTKNIQTAIDNVASLPLVKGFRGVVLLDTGIFTVSNPLRISASGIVLRGAGPGKKGTIIRDVSGRPEAVTIIVSGGEPLVLHDAVEITSDQVPVGTRTFTVADGSQFRAGDSVLICRPVNEQWIKDVAHVDIMRRPNDLSSIEHTDTTTWKTDQFNLKWVRVITIKNKNEITVDFPIPSRIDKFYGTGTIARIKKDPRLTNIGIEDILFISRYDKNVIHKTEFGDALIDENHSNYCIDFSDNVKDSWMRRCVGFFYWRAFVWVKGKFGASNITIEDCAMLDPVSKNNGWSMGDMRAYNFMAAGNRILFQRLYSRGGRHDLVMSHPREGNVFLDCVTEITTLNNEPHQNWTNGSLYDCCTSDKPFLLIYVGISHGKRNANNMLWNCKVYNSDPEWNNWRFWGRENDNRISVVGVEPRPGTNIKLANNYAIGCTAELFEHQYQYALGRRTLAPVGAEGIVESKNTPREPRSLYLQQLKERIGTEAVENIAIPQQLDSSEAVWAYLRDLYKDIPHFGDPDDLDWLPAMISFVKPVNDSK